MLLPGNSKTGTCEPRWSGSQYSTSGRSFHPTAAAAAAAAAELLPGSVAQASTTFAD